MDRLLQSLSARFKDTIINSQCHRGQLTLEIHESSVHQVCLALRNEAAFSFEQLSDLCGVDYSSYAQGDWQTTRATNTGFSRGRATTNSAKNSDLQGLAVVYHLLSLKYNHRIRLKVFLSGDLPQVQSVTDIWSSADWYEREVFDLFGILFLGHPDLRRILTDYGFIGYPLRKDFPLEGRVEVRYDPDKKRVIYQPTTIDNRVLVPRVLRPEEIVKEKG